ncbi:hypothetical protein O1611_g8251 [Lasiodiplodia mahajangana]|uniref:Uncharacterized protein n=1 Tax=Lasiodiplodia mahajangana TaxID=1108764 RepID=A0ACC2JCZ9_9PEZI|nr:hypothetical protein O1611_g8251 [Lasiodiplodia mahajangana]
MMASTTPPQVGRFEKIVCSQGYLNIQQTRFIQIWGQKTGDEHDLMFFVVDMDQIAVSDFVKTSNDLMDMIKSESDLSPQHNNMDHWVSAELPCGCDQENSPLPSLKQIPGSPEYELIRGKWHDPNKCDNEKPLAATSQANNTTRAFGYTATPQKAISPGPGGVSMLTDSTVADGSYSPEEAAAASPTGIVIFSPRFEYLAPYGAERNTRGLPVTCKASPLQYPTDISRVNPPSTVSTAALGPLTSNVPTLPNVIPSQGPDKAMPPTSRPISNSA